LRLVTLAGYLFGFAGFIPMFYLFLTGFFNEGYKVTITLNNFYNEPYIELVAICICFALMIVGAFFVIKDYLGDGYEKKDKTKT